MDARPRLLDPVRDALRTLHYRYLTEKQYLGWISRYIVCHRTRHPRAMGAARVELPSLDGVELLHALARK